MLARSLATPNRASARQRRLDHVARCRRRTCCWPWSGRGRLPCICRAAVTPDPGDPLLVTYLLWWNAHAVPFTHAWWNAPFFWPMPGALALTEHVRRAVAHHNAHSAARRLAAPRLQPSSDRLVVVERSGDARARSPAHRQRRRRAASPASRSPWRRIAQVSSATCSSTPAGGCRVALLALHAYVETGRRRWLAGLRPVVAAAGAHERVSAALLSVADCRLDRVVHAVERARQTGARHRSDMGRLLAAARSRAARVSAGPDSSSGLERNRAEMIFFSADWSSFLSATPVLRFWHTLVPRTTEGYLFPGLTVVTLVVLASGATRCGRGRSCSMSRRRWSRLVSASDRRTAVLDVGAVASVRVADVAARLQRPARACTLFPADDAVSLVWRPASPLAHLAAAIPPSTSARLLWCFAGLWIDGAITAMPMGVPPGRLAYVERGGRLLYLPFDDLRLSVRAMYQSMPDRLTVVNGYAGYVPPHVERDQLGAWRDTTRRS